MNGFSDDHFSSLSPPRSPTSSLHRAMLLKFEEQDIIFTNDMTPYSFQQTDYSHEWQSTTDPFGFHSLSPSPILSQPTLDPKLFHPTTTVIDHAPFDSALPSYHDGYQIPGWTFPIAAPAHAFAASSPSSTGQVSSFSPGGNSIDMYAEVVASAMARNPGPEFNSPQMSAFGSSQTPELEFSPYFSFSPFSSSSSSGTSTKSLPKEEGDEVLSTPVPGSTDENATNQNNGSSLRRTALQPMKGQRLKGDGDAVLKNHFKNDPTLLRIVQYIYTSPWFASDELEPKCDEVFTQLGYFKNKNHRDAEMRRLGVAPEDSIFAVFCDGGLKCLLPHGEKEYRMNSRDRPQRRIGHIRSHFDHRPYVCDGDCTNTKSSSSRCDLRFHGQEGLTGHRSRNGKKEPCCTCRAMILARNMKRHTSTCRGLMLSHS